MSKDKLKEVIDRGLKLKNKYSGKMSESVYVQHELRRFLVSEFSNIAQQNPQFTNLENVLIYWLESVSKCE